MSLTEFGSWVSNGFASLELDTAGLWLLGIGAFTLLAERMVDRPRPRSGLTFPGAASGFVERLRFVLEVAGLLLTAIGSALFVAAHLPPAWFMLLTVAVISLGVFGLLSWLALQYWRFRLAEAVQALGGDLKNPLVQWQVDCMRSCASWRWVMRHPFERAHWPASCHARFGPPPAGLPEEPHEVTRVRLERMEDGASLAHELAVPDLIRDVVDAADRQGWRVGATSSVIAFYPPSGGDPIVIRRSEADADVRGLARQWLLVELQQRGFPVQEDIRGLHPDP